MRDSALPVRLEHRPSLGRTLGVDLYVARDDLLPFPLAGNKVRKLAAELSGLPAGVDTVISNGAIDSNHCRTIAWLAAERGLRAHLILHDEHQRASTSPALRLLEALGATFTTVLPSRIGPELNVAEERLTERGSTVHRIAGGCHTRLGAIAYRDAAIEVVGDLEPDAVFVASGTGATQGGIAAGIHQAGSMADVIGVSVARSAERGTAAVVEAAAWAGSMDLAVTFDDGFTAGGYGAVNNDLLRSVQRAWRHGLPLDPTYTGKAFWALESMAAQRRFAGKRILFWHTGGLWNGLQALNTEAGENLE